MLRVAMVFFVLAMVGCDLIDSIKEEVNPPKTIRHVNVIGEDSVAVVDSLERK